MDKEFFRKTLIESKDNREAAEALEISVKQLEKYIEHYNFNVSKLKLYRRNRNIGLIKQAVENSETPEEAAKKLEINVRVLKDYLKIYKVNAKKFRKKKDFYSDLNEEDVISALKSSRSIASAAKKLGVSHNKLDSFIYYNKIPTLFTSKLNKK